MHCIKGYGTGALLLAVALACSAGLAAEGDKKPEGFNHPAGVALDGADNIYVADTNNAVIRKVSATGAITTIAGMFDVAGHHDGAADMAAFRAPRGVAVDGAGNIYVADTGNDTIRKITPNGTVTTLAGASRLDGASDGRGDAARFNAPTGLATDKAGNLYVADTGNHAIRKIAPDGKVTTLARMPTLPSAASVSAPTGVAVGNDGNVYVADSGHHVIRKITPTGTVSTLAGSGQPGSADGTGAQASFGQPFGLVIDQAGNLYVTDAAYHTVRKITPQGVVTTFAGTAGIFNALDGMRAGAKFFNPTGLAIGRDGHLYVADTGNNEVRHISPAGLVTTVAGFPPAADENPKARGADAPAPAAPAPAAPAPAAPAPAAPAPAAPAPNDGPIDANT